MPASLGGAKFNDVVLRFSRKIDEFHAGCIPMVDAMCKRGADRKSAWREVNKIVNQRFRGLMTSENNG